MHMCNFPKGAGMKYLCFLTLIVAALVQYVPADTKSDVLALTGNAQTKLVWIRYPWCDSAYNPIKPYRTSDGENKNAFTQLVVFSTDEGVERYLEKDIGYHFSPRITRKSGKCVIWSDKANTCAWIKDYAGISDKRKLLDGGDYIVVHCRYDSSTDK